MSTIKFCFILVGIFLEIQRIPSRRFRVVKGMLRYEDKLHKHDPLKHIVIRVKRFIMEKKHRRKLKELKDIRENKRRRLLKWLKEHQETVLIKPSEDVEKHRYSKDTGFKQIDLGSEIGKEKNLCLIMCIAEALGLCHEKLRKSVIQMAKKKK